MIKEKRIQQIQEYVLENQSASLDELVGVFNVSKNTIRRDIQELVDRGDFLKVYGGISVKQESQGLESFQDRRVKNQAEKNLIGKLAANFVEDGDIIFIDSGTTTIEMVDYIKDKKLTILTNSLELIIRSLSYTNLNMISTGGILERDTSSFYNYNNLDLLKNYNVNKAFMASTGISKSNGVTNSSPYETGLKRTIVDKSRKVFLLVDHGKFEKYGLMTYCNLADIDYLITNQAPSGEYQEYFKKNNIQAIFPNT